jgi:hypothetical protein
MDAPVCAVRFVAAITTIAIVKINFFIRNKF